MERTIAAPGVYDLDMDAYHSDPCVDPSISASGLKAILDCPARFWAFSPRNPDRIERKETPAFALGKAAHVLLIEGEDAFRTHCHVMSVEQYRTNDAKAERDEAIACNMTVIRPSEWDTIRRMRDALHAHSWVRNAFVYGKVEPTLVWQDGKSKTWQRVRPDFLPEKKQFIPDYKTAASCRRDDFSKAIWNYGYHIQAAHYLDGIRAVTGARPERFFFVVQEKEPPYLVAAYPLDGEALAWGQVQVAGARAKFAECLKTGQWPGYTDDHPADIGLPPYAINFLEAAHGEGAFAEHAFHPAAH